jgi:two-component system response regulator FixJ
MCDEAKVFLINDDEAANHALILSLVQGGFNTESHSCGLSFLKAYNGYRPACLVMDLCMLEMDGLEVRQELIKRNIDIPIIFLTGYGKIQESLSTIKTGAVYFLEKPFTRIKLFERIQEALSEECCNRLPQQVQGNTHRDEDIAMYYEHSSNR